MSFNDYIVEFDGTFLRQSKSKDTVNDFNDFKFVLSIIIKFVNN